MKTNKVVAMVLVTVAALSSVACSDAPTEEVGVAGSAATTSIKNGDGCRDVGLRAEQDVMVSGTCFIFRCYDASKAGASNADPRWGNTGTRCTEPAPPAASSVPKDERDNGSPSAPPAPSVPKDERDDAPPPPASSTPPPAAQVCTPGQKQCVKRGSNGKYRMEQCTTDGTDWVTNQAYVPYETTDPTDCRKAAGLPY